MRSIFMPFDSIKEAFHRELGFSMPLLDAFFSTTKLFSERDSEKVLVSYTSQEIVTALDELIFFSYKEWIEKEPQKNAFLSANYVFTLKQARTFYVTQHFSAAKNQFERSSEYYGEMKYAAEFLKEFCKPSCDAINKLFSANGWNLFSLDFSVRDQSMLDGLGAPNQPEVVAGGAAAVATAEQVDANRPAAAAAATEFRLSPTVDIGEEQKNFRETLFYQCQTIISDLEQEVKSRRTWFGRMFSLESNMYKIYKIQAVDSFSALLGCSQLTPQQSLDLVKKVCVNFGKGYFFGEDRILGMLAAVNTRAFESTATPEDWVNAEQLITSVMHGQSATAKEMHRSLSSLHPK